MTDWLQHLNIAIQLAGPLCAVVGFIWAMRTTQAVVIVRLERIEKILMNGNGLLQRLERGEAELAAIKAVCSERHKM